MVKGAIEWVSGKNLLDCLGQIDALTWQTAQEVSESGENRVVNTANIAIYRLKDGYPVLNLTSRLGNILIDERFREQAYHGILENQFYILPEDMQSFVMDAILSAQSVEADYSRLRVKTDGCSKDYGYIKNAGKNTIDETRLFRAVCGKDGISDGMRIYLLREEAVKRALHDNPEGLVARACWFNYDRNFDAYDRVIDNIDSAVRGVRQSIAGDTGKIDPVISAYDAILSDPGKALKAMTPAHAAGLSALVADYLKEIQR